MKCTSKLKKIMICIAACVFLSGCSEPVPLSNAYNADGAPLAYNLVGRSVTGGTIATPFSDSICVITENIAAQDGSKLSGVGSALLVNSKSNTALYAENVHQSMNPASLTKVLTALVALEYGNLEDTITVSENAMVTEDGAQVIGLKAGDKLTLEQALHGLLMYSGNDVALAIAEHVGGSVEQFISMMNETAAKLGATNTHFSNPHGLTDAEHYTTAYDLYLIFNAAIKSEKFVEIIQTNTYTTTYTLADGSSKEVTWNTTNKYLQENSGYRSPENVTVIGGKTGTTAAAGSCLILFSKDASGNNYISVILNADDRTVLYTNMTKLLSLINGGTLQDTGGDPQENT